MKIRHVLSRKGNGLYHVDPDQTLAKAVSLMAQHRVGSLAVMEAEHLVSIVTERDVLRAASEHGERFCDLTVREVMASRLVTCEAEMSLDQAMELMFHNPTGRRIRHLPVVEGDRLVGMISIGDVVESLLTETRFENRLLKHYIQCWPEGEEAVSEP